MFWCITGMRISILSQLSCIYLQTWRFLYQATNNTRVPCHYLYSLTYLISSCYVTHKAYRRTQFRFILCHSLHNRLPVETIYDSPSPYSFWSSRFPLSLWCSFQYSLHISFVPHAQYMTDIYPLSSLEYCYHVTDTCYFFLTVCVTSTLNIWCSKTI